MDNEIIALLQELVQIPSVNPPGDEFASVSVVADWLTARGVQVALVPVQNKRPNLLARVAGAGAHPPLAFCGHFDTVPIGSDIWQSKPFGGEIKTGRMYGRGTADMKGGIAAIAGALAALARQRAALERDVLFLGTVGEEVDCCGARHFMENKALDGVGALVIAEPTNLEIGIAHKGALWLQVKMAGRSAHGSMPALGINAIMRALEFVNAAERYDFGLEPHPLLGSATVSPDQIHGGLAPNVVPDECAVVLDVRTIPSLAHSQVLESFRALADAIQRSNQVSPTTIEVLLERAPLNTSPDAALVAAALAANVELGRTPTTPKGFPFFTDASILASSGNLPTIIWGPGEPEQAHRADESIPLANVLEAARLYQTLALNLQD